MKEITRIHLAKTPFSVEVDAKKVLERYLRDIEKVMKAEPEAMREIEARMVELLAERGVKADGVIGDSDVDALRQQMGEPKEFSDGDEELIEPEEISDKPIKRLMRDTDNAIFGGVCAGIAAYFGINPLWIRLIAIISPFVTFGTMLLVYVVLWIATPPARTAAEKLQMRGEAVTLDALKRLAASEEVAQETSRVAGRVGRVILGTTLLLMAFGVMIGLVVGGVFGIGVVSLMEGLPAQSWAWGLWASLAIGGLAGFGLLALLAHSAFKWQVKRPVGVAMIVMLAIVAFSISAVALFGAQTAEQYARDEKRLTKVVPIALPVNLEGVKYVDHKGHLVLDNDNRSSKIRAELRYFAPKNAEPPKVTVEREGDTLNVFVEEPKDCVQSIFLGWHGCLGRTAQVNFYGPVEYWQDPSLVDSHEDRFELPDQD